MNEGVLDDGCNVVGVKLSIIMNEVLRMGERKELPGIGSGR